MPPAKLYAELSAYLESMIASGGFAPGEKLPAQRKLCQEFGLTKSTVGRALKELEARGLVEMRHGSGCFVRRPAARRGRYNLMVYTESDAFDRNYCGRIIIGLQKRAAELGCGIMLNFVKYAEFQTTPLRRRETDFDAVILVGSYDVRLDEFSCRRPCVGVNMHRSFGCLSTLEMDPVEAADLAAGYLRRHGVRHAVCISAAGPVREPRTVFDFRMQCFLARWEGSAEAHAQDSCEDPAFFDRLPPDSGLWFASDTRCRKTMRICREMTGRDLRDRFPIVANDGRSWLAPQDFARLPSIMPDYEDMGRGGADEAVRRIEFPGTPCRRIYQSVVLKESPQPQP